VGFLFAAIKGALGFSAALHRALAYQQLPV
jgi:hypothetical protein